MKKSNLFFAMAAGAMLVSSCASEQEMPNTPANSEAGKQLIVLSVANDNDNTRAGRPLESSEPAQAIDYVKVIVTDNEDKVVWTHLVEEWNTDAVSTVYTHGRQTTIEIPKSECTLSTAATASYNIFAVGYSDNSDYDLSAIEAVKKNDKFTSNVAIALKAGKAQKGAWAEEIFAGDLAELPATENGLKAEVVLNRQVAGTFGYMDEIPYATDNDGNVGKYLHLVASNYCDQIVLGQFRNTDHENDAYLTSTGNNFVVNGINATGAEQVIYTINLEDWFGENFTELKDEDGKSKGIIDPATWVNKTDKDAQPYHFVKGSVFASSFLHPFRKINGTNTFRLLLTTDADGQNVLKEWAVTLPSGPQTKNYTLWYFDAENNWVSNNAAIDVTRIYNVLRNHLYTIGVKAKAEPKDPNNPEDPDPDPDPEDPEDDPTPLNNKQEITLKVNSNWEVIHKMGLE